MLVGSPVEGHPHDFASYEEASHLYQSICDEMYLIGEEQSPASRLAQGVFAQAENLE